MTAESLHSVFGLKENTSGARMMCSRVRLLSPHLPAVRLVGTVASRTAVNQPADRLSASLAFDDPSAFRVKSWPELLRALGVFRFCSFPVLVNNSARVRNVSWVSDCGTASAFAGHCGVAGDRSGKTIGLIQKGS